MAGLGTSRVQGEGSAPPRAVFGQMFHLFTVLLGSGSASNRLPRPRRLPVCCKFLLTADCVFRVRKPFSQALPCIRPHNCRSLVKGESRKLFFYFLPFCSFFMSALILSKLFAATLAKAEDCSGFASDMKSGHRDLGSGSVIICANRKGAPANTPPHPHPARPTSRRFQYIFKITKQDKQTPFPRNCQRLLCHLLHFALCQSVSEASGKVI